MDKIEDILAQGGAVILPTETVYGIFAQALNQAAVAKVYQLKNRPQAKAMTLNVADLDGIRAYSQNQPPYLEKLYQAFLPGPLTLILEANDKVPFWINSGGRSVGFRIPKHPKTLKLIRKTGPLIGPSANLSGSESGKTFSQIRQNFNQQLIGLEDDAAVSGIDSTILDLSDGPAKILRQGALSRSDLLAAVPEITFEMS
ncbi:threonylcarbamoyl-AMP synthase [Streptococcus chenjunshii]|uniref:L-threonylcarbamoyladenylate synthase n=1 Tax=Streptococcus chenjunshii TaxID=2173853 RepID=A0A372KQ13_9STRE|nr:L-threonylcarbamoyladenylate synthase [Streptococcus chenjunshii]AXQ78662.1 threonylcarbamoyl-AMP synthase [Streptococcus chenjunshii]RFU51874.1 threonylcarbamoyl-AMP synthase [Streptococcus chenjunshii]RFU54066.1 threonylcarbamoyl-AMP synthase [Streptococcus chenjunshii]